MKKIMLSLGIVLVSIGTINAQGKVKKVEKTAKTETAAPVFVAAPTPEGSGSASSIKVEDMNFQNETHDFGTIPEGPAADYVFTFKNNGTQPILLQTVNASCGCTTPTWSKEPVLPGQEGTIKASFATQGRGGQPFTKNITVVSNAGTKILTIKGNVEKAPTSSVPQNSSLIKTN